MSADTRNGILFILLSSLGYASFPNFTKLIYRYSSLHELDLAFWRFALAVPLMWVGTTIWMRVTQPPRLEKPLPRIHLMLTGVLIAGAALAGFFGLRRIDASIYVVLFFTFPAMVSIITALMGNPMPLRGWIALLVTMLGIVLTVPSILTLDFSGNLGPGILIALLNALFVALFIVLNAYVQRGYPKTARASAWSMTGTLFIFIPVALITGIQLPETPFVWLLFGGLSLLGTVLPFFGLVMGTQLLGASRAAIISATEPVFVFILAFILLQERMQPVQMVGAALIITSVIILESNPGKNPVQRATDAAATAE